MATRLSVNGAASGAARAAAFRAARAACAAALVAAVAAASTGATGCAGGGAHRRAAPLTPGTTVLAGPLPSHRCAAGAATCTCAGSGDDAREKSPVPPGHYRFELALYNTLRSEAELRVGDLGHVFRPTGESLRPDCWLVDLAPGFYPVTYRLAPADGADVTVGLRIRRYAELPGEDGKPAPLWYQVLDLACGEGRAFECDRAALRTWFDRYHAAPGRATDPCGNAGVRSVRWDAFLAPIGEDVDEVDVSFELVVMNPPPDKAPCLEK